MLRRYRIGHIVVLSTLGVAFGCGGSSGDAPSDEDTGAVGETSSDSGVAETRIDTGDADSSTTRDGAVDSVVADSSSDTTMVDASPDSGAPLDGGMFDSPGDTIVVDSGIDSAPDVVPTGSCSAVSITTTGYGDTHVRQGAGAIGVKVIGAGLASVSSVAIGSIACTAIVATTTQVTATCSIPHGATLGATALTLDAGGAATCPGAITIDPISVATTGSDTFVGSATAPFKTVTHGLAMSATGDTVSIGAGTYAAGGAETFSHSPGDEPDGASINVPADVIIQGDPAGGTKLTGAYLTAAMRLRGGALIRDLAIDAFTYGVVAMNGGAATLTNVRITNSVREGVYIGNTSNVVLTAATPGSGATSSQCLLQGNDVGLRVYGDAAKGTLTNCDVVSNLSLGAAAMESGQLTTTSTRFLTNGTSAPGYSSPIGFTTRMGVWIEGDIGGLTMTGGEISGSRQAGLFASGSITVKLTDVVIQRNGTDPASASTGVIVAGSLSISEEGTLDILRGEISSNGGDGLNVSGDTNVTLTDTVIARNGAAPFSPSSPPVGLRFGASSLSAKGITITDNPGEQILLFVGSDPATKIELLADGTTPTILARTTKSLTVPLVRDSREATLTGAASPRFAASTKFQGITMPVAIYTALPHDFFDAVPNTQLVFRIDNAGRQIQVF